MKENITLSDFLINLRLFLYDASRVTLLVACLLLLSCRNNNNSGISNKNIINPATANGVDEKLQANMAAFQFETLAFNFGKVIQGEQLSYTFRFTNSGKQSLLISSVNASCGCTTSIPPKAPIKPGEKGELTITFDSKYKAGEVTSYLIVAANTYPANTILTIKADVITP